MNLLKLVAASIILTACQSAPYVPPMNWYVIPCAEMETLAFAQKAAEENWQTYVDATIETKVCKVGIQPTRQIQWKSVTPTEAPKE